MSRPVLPKLLVCAAASAFAFASVSAAGCTPQGDPAIAGRFRERFDRADLGTLWNNTGGNWRVSDGALRVQGGRNHPLWLKRRLPRDVRIEFDAKSDSPDGDLKVEVFGDGTSSAVEASYTATSYVIIFGGWRNTLDVLARMDEHAENRVARPSRRVIPGRMYHFKIERRGQRIAAWVDGELLVEMTDPEPLEGRGHDHFGFNDWDAALTFDNLVITPL
jgi:hypothetical protein